MPAQDESTRRQIILLLKRHGEMTTVRMADVIGITSMGVRQHLNSLERDGYVRPVTVRQKRGRPTYVYRLTEAAEEFFPARYGQLTLDLLDQLVRMDGPEKVDQLFIRRMERLELEYRRRMENHDFAGRVEALARIRDDEGYMAEAGQAPEEEYTLVEHHCPIYEVARRFPQACQYEQELLTRILGVEVRRTEHRVAGDHQCRYVMKKPVKTCVEHAGEEETDHG